MKNIILNLLLLLLPLNIFAQSSGGSGGRSASNRPVVLNDVTIIDVRGLPTKTGMIVIISDNRIAAIGKRGKIKLPKDAQIIDAAGKFLIPGLWDMHVHLGDADFDKNSNLPLFIANGITGVRIMEGAPEFHLWRKEIEAQNLLGPRMIIASQVIGAGDLSNISETRTREEVRLAKKEGADFIKVHDNLSKESYFALIDEAKQVRLPVEGHVPVSITAGEASNAGQKSIEHFTGLDEAKSDPKKALALFRILKKNGTWLCPTLVMRHNYAFLNDPNLSNDPRLKFAKPSWRKRWLNMNAEAQNWSPNDISVRKETILREDNLVAEMQKYGLGILAGTDDANPFVMPGFGLHDELALLVSAGLTPMQALQTATINPAKFFNQFNKLGSVEKGKLADLVLLDANPLENIRNTQRINAVIVNGRYFEKRALEKILSDIEAASGK